MGTGRHRARYWGYPLPVKSLGEGNSWGKGCARVGVDDCGQEGDGAPTDGVDRKVSFAHS